MSKNIEINILTDSSTNTYEALYPKTLMSNITGNLSASRIDDLPKDIYIVEGTYIGSGGDITIQFNSITSLTAQIFIIIPIPYGWYYINGSNATSGESAIVNYPIIYSKKNNTSNSSGIYYLNNKLTPTGQRFMIDSLTNSSCGVGWTFNTKGETYNFIVIFY